MRAIAFGLLFVGSEVALRRRVDPVSVVINIAAITGTVVCIVGGW